MSDIEYFFNKRMELLIIINNHQINVGDIIVCPMNQQEMANALGCSKSTLNKILKELINDGYVEVYKEGKYVLTDKSKIVIDRIDLIKG